MKTDLRLLPLLLLLHLATTFNHGFETSASMTFADMNAPKILTNEEIAFVSSHYRIFSMEKCSGSQSGNTTEDFIYSTALRLKRLDNTTKTIFYWPTDQQGIWCYKAAETFNARHEWHFLDDYGNLLHISSNEASSPTKTPTPTRHEPHHQPPGSPMHTPALRPAHSSAASDLPTARGWRRCSGRSPR